MHDTILIYSSQTSARLHYVLNWLLDEQLGIKFKITQDKSETLFATHVISYGESLENALSIPDTGLLWETGIQPQQIIPGQWQNIPTFFSLPDCHLPFDIFSAIFFLLSRYEEYYNYTPDKHGRYPVTESIIYKNGWLERPILDEWVRLLKKLLADKQGIQFTEKKFEYVPTYDIDIAYSYKHKGFYRTTGAFAKDFITLKWGRALSRASVLSGAGPDPYDSFKKLFSLHSRLGIKPIYFVLAAQSSGPFDKNISPSHHQMQALIKQLSAGGDIGLHPSYYSDVNPQLLKEEKTILDNIIQNTITISRQHYIKIQLPETYRRLISAGITDDYSMGYATHIGFRAGTGQSFPWYDLENESVSPLRIHPFCFMDTTAHFEMALDVSTAFIRLRNMAQLLRESNSRLITVFHNFSLGTDKEWNGWNEAYSLFLNEYFGTDTNH